MTNLESRSTEYLQGALDAVRKIMTDAEEPEAMERRDDLRGYLEKLECGLSDALTDRGVNTDCLP